MILVKGKKLPAQVEDMINSEQSFFEKHDIENVLKYIPNVIGATPYLFRDVASLDLQNRPPHKRVADWLIGNKWRDHMPGQVKIDDIVIIGLVADEQPIALHYTTEPPTVICLLTDDKQDIDFWVKISNDYGKFLSMIEK